MAYQRYRPANWPPCFYAGSAIGAVFAGDLVTLFFYWEGTAIASVFLIWARRTEARLSHRAALSDHPDHLGCDFAGRAQRFAISRNRLYCL